MDEDSVFTDSTDCLVEASFTYEISGGYLNLTNTTSGAEYPVYSWWVDGLSSWEENPSFSRAFFEYEENVCLEVYDSRVIAQIHIAWLSILEMTQQILMIAQIV